MSLYNTLFGENSESHVLLGMIGVNKEYFDRYRDVELIEDGTKIRVFTRLGRRQSRGLQKHGIKFKAMSYT